MKSTTNDTSKSKGRDSFQAEFESLPLDEKFARLMHLEMATISEAVSFAVNSPMKVVEKFGDMLSDLGTKIETEARKAATTDPAEPKAAKAPRTAPRKAKTKPPTDTAAN